MSVTVVDLLSMSHDELDELFRASPAGPIPVGEDDGTAIFAPDTPVSDVARQARTSDCLERQGVRSRARRAQE